MAAHCRAWAMWRSRKPIHLANGTIYNSLRTPEAYHTIVAGKVAGCPKAFSDMSELVAIEGSNWKEWYGGMMPAGQDAPWPPSYDTGMLQARRTAGRQ